MQSGLSRNWPVYGATAPPGTPASVPSRSMSTPAVSTRPEKPIFVVIGRLTLRHVMLAHSTVYPPTMPTAHAPGYSAAS